MKKKLINYIVLLSLVGITVWMIASSSDIYRLPGLLTKTNKGYLLLAFLCMIGYWVFDALIITNISKMLNIKNNIIQSLKFTMIGQYYSLITPFSSGGQPAQVYSMVNDSIPIGKATSILIEKFIIYQIIVTLYSIIMFILRLSFVYTRIKTALPFMVIGIMLNFIGLITILILFLNPGLLKKITMLILQFLNKIKIIKDIDKYKLKAESHLIEYEQSIIKIRENKGMTVRASIMTIIQLTLYFSITYFIYLSLGLGKATYVDIISIQSLLYMTVSFIPTPGTVGASEGGFYVLFKVFFGANLLVYAMLLWRIISYYLSLSICGIVTLIDYLVRKRRRLVLEE